MFLKKVRGAGERKSSVSQVGWNIIKNGRIEWGMRAYRYQYKKRKKINTVPFVLVVGMAALLLFFQGNKGLGARLGKETVLVCYQRLLDFYMPGMTWEGEETGEESLAEAFFSHIFPICEENMMVGTYETQVESALSYEMILAREAADENYVDNETGEVVETGTGPEDYGVAEIGTGQEGAEEPAAEVAADELQMVSSVAGQKTVTYAREKLNDFDYLIQNFYQVDNTTTINSSQLNAEALLGKDERLTHDASTPQILIYHTHSQEGYADSVEGDASTSVVGVGDYLTKLLTEQYGLNVIHHTGEYDVADRDQAYSAAGPAVEQILKDNPSIEVVIDLHRDGVREDTRLVTEVNGTQMAQIMFFNGLSRTTSMGDIDYLYNPYISDNLAVSFQMQLAASEYYPGYARRIYLKGYRYNMHYCPKTLLIEVGAQTNTLPEAMNAMVPLADILNKVLTGQE